MSNVHADGILDAKTGILPPKEKRGDSVFYKEKGFYISLLCGIVALAAFGGICFHLAGNDKGDGDVTELAQVTQEAVTTVVPKVKEASINEAVSEVNTKAAVKAKKTPKPVKKTVETDAEPLKNTLHFDQEAGLLWPVKGDVLMEYSAEQVVYFKTLAQYRTNPALIISAKENAEVKASADGIVTAIETSEETGRTVSADIGDGFTVKYGQLKEITVQSGDRISEGQVIGKIAAPTKYFSVEGPNLYYQVMENKDTVNPLVLLR